MTENPVLLYGKTHTGKKPVWVGFETLTSGRL
jgi:hypothetical protein